MYDFDRENVDLCVCRQTTFGMYKKKRDTKQGIFLETDVCDNWGGWTDVSRDMKRKKRKQLEISAENWNTVF